MSASSPERPQPSGPLSRDEVLGTDELIGRVFQFFARDQRTLYGILPLVCKRWNGAAAELQTELDVHVTDKNSTAISTAMWVSRNGRRLKTFRMVQGREYSDRSPYWHSILVNLSIHAPRLRLKELVLRFRSEFESGLDALHFLAPACRELVTLEIDMIDAPYLASEASTPMLVLLGSCSQLQQLRLLHMDMDAKSDPLGQLEALPWPEWPSQLTSLHVSDVKREVGHSPLTSGRC